MTLLLAWLVANALHAAIGATRFGPAVRQAGWLLAGLTIVLATLPAVIVSAALRRVGLAGAA